MEKQIDITAVELATTAALAHGAVLRPRSAAFVGNADLFGAASVDDPRPPGPGPVPLR